MIRVLVIADTLADARSIASLLSDDERLEIVNVRASPSSGNPLNVDRESGVDVVVFAGASAANLPRRGPPVVALANGATPDNAFDRNLHAWLPFDASAGEIAAAIAAAAQDMMVLSREQARRWLRKREPARDETVMSEPLTTRELQVLRMLGDGLGNKEIAGRLGISDHTAKFHVAQILGKLGVASRAEAVATGMRRGLIPI